MSDAMQRIERLEQRLRQLDGLDPARLRDAVEWAEGQRQKRSVEVLNPSLYGMAPDTLGTNTRSGSTPNATINTTAINDAIQGLKKSDWREPILYSSGGWFPINSSIVWNDIGGAVWIAGSPNISQGNDPVSSSWATADVSSNLFWGTEFYGSTDDAMVIIDDCSNLRFEGVGLRGDFNDQPPVGVIVQKTGGLGPSTIWWNQLSVQNCVEGMNVGRCIMGGTADQVNGTTFDASTVSSWMFRGIEAGYHKVHITAVNSGTATIGSYAISSVSAGSITLGSSASSGTASVEYHIAGPDTTEACVNANCSEIVLNQPQFRRCTDGYRIEHNQAINHILIQPQFTEISEYAIYQNNGGNIIVLQPTSYDIDKLVGVCQGSGITGPIICMGTRIDGQGTYRTRVYDYTGLGAGTQHAMFLGGAMVDDVRDAGTNAAFVFGEHNHLWVTNFQGVVRASGNTGPLFASAANGNKTIIVQQTSVPGESLGSVDRAQLMGTIGTGTQWRLQGMIDDGSTVSGNRSRFLADAEYPRVNGRSSTHRYIVESDFESVECAPFKAVSTGTAATVDEAQPWAAYNVGILQPDTGTDSTGAAGIITATNSVIFGGGRWRIEVLARLIQLSVASGGLPDPTNVTIPYGGTTGTEGAGDSDDNDANEYFTVRIGFADNALAAPTNGALFLYSEGNANWQCVTISASGSTTTTDSGVTADQSVALFEIQVNPAGTSVTFYINGTLVATHTTNIPASTEPVGMMPISIVKTAGNSNRYTHVDYAKYELIPSTARGTAFNK